jgi:cytochrome c peroxidase
VRVVPPTPSCWTTRCTTYTWSASSRTSRPDGSFKSFTQRGIKDSPPYLHDGRFFTLEDTVEFFNLVLELKLSGADKHDLVAFLRQV